MLKSGAAVTIEELELLSEELELLSDALLATDDAGVLAGVLEAGVLDGGTTTRLDCTEAATLEATLAGSLDTTTELTTRLLWLDAATLAGVLELGWVTTAELWLDELELLLSSNGTPTRIKVSRKC